MLAVTLDVDWAPDKIVDEVISVLDSYRVPATLFCTNFSKDVSGNSSSLAGRFHERHEVALHPNFQHTGTYDEVWDALLKLYPAAKGWRSHNGVTAWPMTSGDAEAVLHGGGGAGCSPRSPPRRRDEIAVRNARNASLTALHHHLVLRCLRGVLVIKPRSPKTANTATPQTDLYPRGDAGRTR